MCRSTINPLSMFDLCYWPVVGLATRSNSQFRKLLKDDKVLDEIGFNSHIPRTYSWFFSGEDSDTNTLLIRLRVFCLFIYYSNTT